MTVAPTSVLAEFVGGSTSDVAMMIGVGLVKDSDAVFFQYLGEEQTPRALTTPTSGKPVYNLVNVRLTGIEIAEDIGEFNSTKLNLFLESNAGNTVMLTSGLTTLWSQCVMTSLMGLFNSYDLDQRFTLNSWKGTSKMRPCFASIKLAGKRVTDDMLYQQLTDARADRNSDLVKRIMRDSVQILSHALKGDAVDVVIEEPAAPVLEAGEDF